MSKRNSTFRKCSWLTAETEHFPAARQRRHGHPSMLRIGEGWAAVEAEGKTILLAPETNTNRQNTVALAGTQQQ